MPADSDVLIVTAVPQEIKAFHQANGHLKGILLFETGMGDPTAFARVRRQLESGRYRAVISAGFAGGVSSGFQVGDLVLASEVIEESTGRRLKPSVLLESGTLPARVGPFVTVKKPLRTPSSKSELGTRFSALAVEMETAGVADAAMRAGIPWMGLRAILDPMEQPLAVSSMGQGLGLLAQPWRWNRLASFLGSVRTAGESLARGLEILVRRMDSRN